MFTGIIETIGKLTAVSARPGGMTLTVQLAPDWVAATERSEVDGGIVRLGDSIAVNGVCLTVTRLTGQNAAFDVSAETIARSTFKNVRPGMAVNLERAMAADARFGGHVVQGHVDGVGRITAINRQSAFAVFTIEAPKELLDQIVVKGSIALDGISLTVASVSGSTFTIAIIPETLARTTWKDVRPGTAVNIETDILLKAVRKQLGNIAPSTPGLTEQKLRDLGF